MSHNESGSWQWVPDVEAAASPPSQSAEAASRSPGLDAAYNRNGVRAYTVAEFLVDLDDAELQRILRGVRRRRYLIALETSAQLSGFQG